MSTKTENQKPTTTLELEGVTIEVQTEDQKTLKQLKTFRNPIREIVNECYSLDVQQKKLAAKLKTRKEELKEMLSAYEIPQISTDKAIMTCSVADRFKKFTDVNAVLDLIPRNLQGPATMSLDRGKIDALITEGNLPKEITKLENFDTVKTVKFRSQITEVKD